MDKNVTLPGTPLKSADFSEGRVIYSKQSPKLEYVWDTGEGMGRYLAGLKEGKLLGVHCEHCDRTLIPPRIMCELCFKPITEWVELKDTGRVNTFALSYVNWAAERVKEPSIPAVIEIDGASEGIGILHILGEVNPDNVAIGMPVQAVWKPAAERQGSILDITHFRPI